MLPARAILKIQGGGLVRAAELSATGGEMLLSPEGQYVKTLKTIHKKANCCFVEVRSDCGKLLVKDDHHLLVEGTDGDGEIELVARDADASKTYRMLTGIGFQEVRCVCHNYEQTMDLVDLTLEDDKRILVWYPDARRRVRKLDDARSFAVLGAHHETLDPLFDENRRSQLAANRSKSWPCGRLQRADRRRLARAKQCRFGLLDCCSRMPLPLKLLPSLCNSIEQRESHCTPSCTPQAGERQP